MFTSTGLTVKPTRSPVQSPRKEQALSAFSTSPTSDEITEDDDDNEFYNPYTADVSSIMEECNMYFQNRDLSSNSQSSVMAVSELLIRCQELEADKDICEYRIRELEEELRELKRRENKDVSNVEYSENIVEPVVDRSFVRKVVVCRKN